MKSPRFSMRGLCVMLVTVFLAAGCVTFLTNLFEPTPTYTLTIEGKEVVVKLPKDFPNMDKAIQGGERCWNAKLCVQQFYCKRYLKQRLRSDVNYTQ